MQQIRANPEGAKMMTKPVTLLLVEDDPLDVMAMERGMKKHRVLNPLVTASNGRIALDMLRGENGQTKIDTPCIILLDINMPVMSGIEFLENIGADKDLNASVIFVLTGSEHDSDIVSEHKDLIAGYILKENLGTACVELFDALKTFWRMIELPVD
ncbi:response regulator [Stieleria marina]|uniref:Response regulator rcp1 n=1 Tax=Stieleria marina TaxID=1930275 RepID=A0A517NNB1_9BACT|nr:Response regulator rcp1 [Planctomycetes bacterium K23_9]